MLVLLQGLFQWLARHFISFVVIVLILVAGNYLIEEISQLGEMEDVLVEIKRGRGTLDKQVVALDRASDGFERLAKLIKESLEKLDSEVAKLDDEIQQKRSGQKKYGAVLSGLRKGSLDYVRHEIDIQVLEQKRDYLSKLRARLKIRLVIEADRARLEQLRQNHATAYEELLRIGAERDEAKEAMSWLDRINRWSPKHKLWADLEEAYRVQANANALAEERYKRQLAVVQSLELPAEPVFTFPKEKIAQAVAQLDQQIEETESRVQIKWITVLRERVREVFYPALGLLLVVILAPVAIKAFLYFILAPWTTGRPPIRLLTQSAGAGSASPQDDTDRNPTGRISAVSIPIVLSETQELLIDADYLQSTSVLARKRTKWLLNARIPLSSVLSGMFMLTRVSSNGSEPIVISATKNPLIEVGMVELQDGAPFVCQPRTLVGVIQDPARPISIKQHWRLGSLQSWLTLQLRFLVFHGPGTLILKGCGGIRSEQAVAARLINQSATLGFSANLEYANTRCETFLSYLTGKEDLFNDRFTGRPGVYVYEEVPDLKRATGAGRYFEGLTDAMLKLFGV